ncbi:MAG: hypothetical protein ACLQPV_10090 [Vulcanimicrobiaceae bacterium]
MDETDSQGNFTATPCRFCGCDDGGPAAAADEKRHLQVVVACGKCGHPFVALSRN